MDHERHAHQLLPDLEAVAVHRVLAEGLAVVARQDDRRTARVRRLRDGVEDAADELVRERDLAVVEIALGFAEGRDVIVLEVVGVRVEVMDP